MQLKSPRTGEDCTEAQYLAETIVQREIDKKKAIVPKKWWNQDPWKKKYCNQIIAANGLLKVFSFQAIIKALETKECSWMWSLRTKDLATYISIEQDKIDKIKQNIEQSQPIDKKSITSFDKTKYGKQSKLDKLRD